MTTHFQKKVYELCSKVPFGRVATYKEIGKVLGRKGQIYRAVGRALNKNSFSPKVPCHRVVCSDGRIGGFAFGQKNKIKLLKKEGIKIKNGIIENFEKVFVRF